MSVELKIKAKHLALEPAIIRKEEYKLTKQMEWFRQHHQVKHNTDDVSYSKLYDKRQSLYLHRIQDVRNESRATHLARAFIKGTPYKVVEKSTKESISYDYPYKGYWFNRMLDMVAKYGAPEDRIGKYWHKETGTHYRKEEHEVLKAKIKSWIEAE